MLKKSTSTIAPIAFGISTFLAVGTCQAGFVSGFQEGFKAGSCVILLAAFGAFIAYMYRDCDSEESADC